MGAYYLRTAPAGSSMRWLYDNKIKGKEDQFEYTSFLPMVTRAVEEPKTLLYWVYHPYTQGLNSKSSFS